MASVICCDEETPLLADNLPLQTPKNHTRDVHILSLVFLLIFLAYGAARIYREQDLGTTSLGIFYLSFTFFSLIASLVVRLLGSKNALVLGTAGYWLFVAANLKPNWYTLVPASLYLGFSASIIWVGQGTYLTFTARSHAKDHNTREGAVIGDFNGEFWAVYALHQFAGNLITFALLRDGQEGSGSGTTSLFIVLLSIMTLGSISILTSGLTSITSIVSVGAFFHAIVLILLLLHFSITASMLDKLYPLLLAALLGIGDGVLNTQLNALLGMLFKNDTEGAFAQLKIWHSAAIAVVFFISPYISFQAMLVIMVALLCSSFFCFLLLTLKVAKASSSTNV